MANQRGLAVLEFIKVTGAVLFLIVAGFYFYAKLDPPAPNQYTGPVPPEWRDQVAYVNCLERLRAGQDVKCWPPAAKRE